MAILPMFLITSWVCFSRALSSRSTAFSAERIESLTAAGLLGGLGLLFGLGGFLRSLLGCLGLVLGHFGDLLESGFAILGGAVLLHQLGLLVERLLHRLIGSSRHQALRRQDLGALDDLGLAVLVE